MRKNDLALKVKDLLIIVFNITLMLINLLWACGIIAASIYIFFYIPERFILFTLPVLLTIGMIIKEFKVKNIVKRIYINLFLFLGFFLTSFYMYMLELSLTSK
jgi:hypothetical protein